MSEEKKCPECLSNIDKAAEVCRFCGNRIVGIECKNCASICKPKAKSCKWCGETFPIPRKKKVKLEKDVEIKASFWGTLLSRRSFYPQRIILTTDKIVIRTYRFLMMKKKDKTITWDKIKGLDHKKKYSWRTIIVSYYEEQPPTTIDCFQHSDAVFMKGVFQDADFVR